MVIGAYRIETLYQEIATALKGLAMTWWWETGCADSEQSGKLKFEYQDTCTPMNFRRELMAPFSSRETWAWEICSSFATSIWVLPS